MKKERETICPHCYNPVWLYEDETVTVCPFCNGIVYDYQKKMSGLESAFWLILFLFLLPLGLILLLVFA